MLFFENTRYYREKDFMRFYGIVKFEPLRGHLKIKALQISCKAFYFYVQFLISYQNNYYFCRLIQIKNNQSKINNNQ